MQQPYKSLYINDDILILGVAKIMECLSDNLETGREALVFR